MISGKNSITLLLNYHKDRHWDDLIKTLKSTKEITLVSDGD